MKKGILLSIALSAFIASSASANPVLYAYNAQQECSKVVENSDSFGISITKKTATSVSVRFKKVKGKKVENSVFRTAKSEFKNCMIRQLEPQSIEVK